MRRCEMRLTWVVGCRNSEGGQKEESDSRLYMPAAQDKDRSGTANIPFHLPFAYKGVADYCRVLCSIVPA